jgi:hypothetical protein
MMHLIVNHKNNTDENSRTVILCSEVPALNRIGSNMNNHVICSFSVVLHNNIFSKLITVIYCLE